MPMLSSYIVPSKSFGSIPAQTKLPIYKISWYATTTTNKITTVTNHVNATAVNLIQERIIYCPFNETYYGFGYTPADLPGNCSSILNPYCFPSPNLPVPKSTQFPSSCLPQNCPWLDPPEGATATVTTAPEQSGIASNCKYT